METYFEQARQVPVHAAVDVLVVGSGPAGLSAAIAAAREGMDTLIVERYGCFGGVITQVGIEALAWYRHSGTVEAGGLLFEFEATAKAMGASSDECQSDSQALDAEMFKYCADRLILDAGVVPMLHCFGVAAMLEDNKVVGIVTESKSGRMAIRAKRVIDCTGDGDIAALAGAPYTKYSREKLMAATQVFSCSGLEIEAFKDYVRTTLKPTYRDWGGDWAIKTSDKEDEMFSPYIARCFEEAVQEGMITKDEFVSLGGTWSTIKPNGDITQLNLVFQSNIDSTDVEDLTKGEIMGRDNAIRAIKVLNEKVPGFRNARLRNFGMAIGCRESRKINGVYCLTEHDVLNQAKFEDSIGIYPEFIDGCGILILPTTGRYFQVPYRALVPQEIDNLLVAGRCISGDRIAHSAFRNMSCCVVTGQGAGIAAAVSIKDKVTTAQVDLKKVQKRLEKQHVRVF
jgi:ribulose 1,5-bisphosphate synthetase/thiazole synthase